MSLTSNPKEPIKCVSLNNQPCHTKPTLVNINTDETLFYPFNVSVNTCGGSCSTINKPCAQEFVPSNVKYMNVEVFNLMSGVNEKIFLIQY